MPSQDELVELIINAMDSLESGNPALNKLASYLYKSDDKLPDFLDKLKIYTELQNPTRPQTQEAGKLLEQIVFLLFKGLKGGQSIKTHIPHPNCHRGKLLIKNRERRIKTDI
jgi:hypothetical protein